MTPPHSESHHDVRVSSSAPALTRGQLVVIAVAILAVIAAVVSVAVTVPSALRASAPDRPVRAYMQAIVAGDVSKALRLGRVTPGAGDKMLTDAAYGQSSDRITAFSVLGTTPSTTGRTATVQVRITQGADSYSAAFDIERGGVGPLAPWRLAKQQLPEITVHLEAPLDLPIIVGGVQLTTSKGVITEKVLPGTYEATTRTAGDIQLVDSAATATFASTHPAPAVMQVQLADSGRTQASSLVTAWITQCAASSELHPSGCPFRALPDGSATYTDGRWTIQSQPTFGMGEWNAQLGGWPVTTSKPGYISFTAHATEGDLVGTASTGSNPFSVAGTIVPDAAGKLHFEPSPNYSDTGASGSLT